MMRGLAAVLGLCILNFTARADEAALAFDFMPGGNAAGHPGYDAARGYGFEPATPAAFSIRVAEGNYRVTLRFGASRKNARARVFAERHRLLLDDFDASTASEQSFIVNVRTAELGPLPAGATGGSRVELKAREIGDANWDDKLTVTTSGDSVMHSLDIMAVDVPTLYLAGDSTVADQDSATNGSWGQFVPAFFKPEIAVANHAESGETLKSFVTELRLDKLLSTLRPGDWVMVQFGHNDQKIQWPQTYADAATTYRSWLRTYVAEIRRRGATVILVTSPERRNFDAAGHVIPTLGDYPPAVRSIAREESVALIDLNAMSIEFYEALGAKSSPRAFADKGRDKTHHSEYGAYSLARMVVEGVRAADPRLSGNLADHLSPDVGTFDPSHPDPPPP
jgi:lysophospholipase L1-like esterase